MDVPGGFTLAYAGISVTGRLTSDLTAHDIPSVPPTRDRLWIGHIVRPTTTSDITACVGRVGAARCRAAAAGLASVIGFDHPTEEYGVVGMQLLTDHRHAEVIQPAGRRQLSR